MLLVIDNYDSFTYNIVQYLGEMNVTMQVVRNDQITVEQVRALKPERLLVSPGPCSPNEAGLSNDILREFGPKIPTLGVCLGHQCIGHTFGAKVIVNWLSHVHGSCRHDVRRSLFVMKPVAGKAGRRGAFCRVEAARLAIVDDRG